VERKEDINGARNSTEKTDRRFVDCAATE